MNQVKVTLDEATVVVAQSLQPYVSLDTIERVLGMTDALPPALPLTERQRELLAGSDPVCCAFTRTMLAGTSVRRAEERQIARELEDAYAEHREDEIESRELVGLRLLNEVQVDLGRIVDRSVVADVIDIRSRFRDERAQRGLLAVVA